LRPHIVWFGEAVPMIEKAVPIMQSADIVIVVGTSMQVYPAAGLIGYADADIPKHYVDPNAADFEQSNLQCIKQKAGEALPKLAKELIQKYS